MSELVDIVLVGLIFVGPSVGIIREIRQIDWRAVAKDVRKALNDAKSREGEK